MTEKLTCKMSDGTEWEVVIPPRDDIYGNPHRCYLKPIEREPREWWSVVWNTKERGARQSQHLFKSHDEAARWAKLAR